ncbi:hypothetical protein IE077_002291 [Cardiosporidium cionae]|uniref:Uncharacterized protein n=1 Tax=Cardiosporidium cionae TaxID=476202 RepID=A0ABQ7JFR8_9APIC|nr:hypothetical protein IE077_002291 [Cardiosporidium cionae]|eukprot:KAF8822878.1 hypothetical protein IE077_002291 [Cardiosporidium cionae]
MLLGYHSASMSPGRISSSYNNCSKTKRLSGVNLHPSKRQKFQIACSSIVTATDSDDFLRNKDEFWGLFHAVGKFLWNKRIPKHGYQRNSMNAIRNVPPTLVSSQVFPSMPAFLSLAKAKKERNFQWMEFVESTHPPSVCTFKKDMKCFNMSGQTILPEQNENRQEAALDYAELLKLANILENENNFPVTATNCNLLYSQPKENFNHPEETAQVMYKWERQKHGLDVVPKQRFLWDGLENEFADTVLPVDQWERKLNIHSYIRKKHHLYGFCESFELYQRHGCLILETQFQDSWGWTDNLPAEVILYGLEGDDYVCNEAVPNCQAGDQEMDLLSPKQHRPEVLYPKFNRPLLYFLPEEIIEQTACEIPAFLNLLHHNYLFFYEDIVDVAALTLHAAFCDKNFGASYVRHMDNAKYSNPQTFNECKQWYFGSIYGRSVLDCNLHPLPPVKEGRKPLSSSPWIRQFQRSLNFSVRWKGFLSKFLIIENEHPADAFTSHTIFSSRKCFVELLPSLYQLSKSNIPHYMNYTWALSSSFIHFLESLNENLDQAPVVNSPVFTGQQLSNSVFPDHIKPTHSKIITVSELFHDLSDVFQYLESNSPKDISKGHTIVADTAHDEIEIV